jgi:phosphoglycerate dehydrogenase-like enzyme
VVLCGIPPALDRIRSRFPDLDIVDVSQGVPDGVRGDVLFGGWGPHAVAAMAAGVRWVQLSGTGVDGIPEEVRAAEVLTSARGASAVAISEYVLAVMCASARNLPQNWLAEPPKHWNFQAASTLSGATLCLFGFGGIGQRVARLALAFEMRVLALRRTDAPSPVEGVELVRSFEELAAVADHLVLAAPATELTRHAVGASTLSLVRPGLHLVNIARGSLVDQDALRSALDDGIVARASLDVADPEPLPAGHWMYDHPKVFLTPHASWAGPPLFDKATEIFCDNLGRYMMGEPLSGEVGAAGY